MIRAYTIKDKEELVNLLRLNIPEYFAESEEKDFIEYLDNHLEFYFVVEDNGKIIGAGGFNHLPENNEARISWDIIHPDHQGKGVGKKLTRYRIDLIKKILPITIIRVRTTQLVYKFYEKMGFGLERVEKDFWAEGFDLYQMKMMVKNNNAAIQ